MKILGIGVDIIENKRIAKSIKKKNFLKKIFNKQEIDFFNKGKKSYNFYAKRFAAKESLSKALGSGFRENLAFKDIIILNDKLGKPFFKTTKKLNNLITNKFKIKKYTLFLSISDEKDYSIAFTLLQTFK